MVMSVPSKTTTVLVKSPNCRATRRAAALSQASLTASCLFPRLRRTHSFSRLPCSSISAWYTLYPGQPNTLVQSFSLIGKVYPDSPNLKIPAK
jgi:hypothetical protein